MSLSKIQFKKYNSMKNILRKSKNVYQTALYISVGNIIRKSKKMNKSAYYISVSNNFIL